VGLREDLQTDLKEAFDEDLADGVKTVVLRKRDQSSTVYDPDTGLSTTPSTDYSTRGIFDEYSTLERFNTQIAPTDVKFIIIANELSIVPGVKDKLIDGTNEYSVIRFEKDPVEATYIIHLRRS